MAADRDDDITLEEVDDVLASHDRASEEIRERTARLRQSIRASLEGDHDRAANILDTLEEGDPDG